MAEPVLKRLNELVAIAIHATQEGHSHGVQAFRELEAELLSELGWVAPLYRDSQSYRRGVEAVEMLREAIHAEEVLEPDPDETES